MELGSSDAKTWNLRALAQRCLKNYSAAIADLTEAVTKEPDNVDFFFNRSQCYQETGEHELATAGGYMYVCVCVCVYVCIRVHTYVAFCSRCFHVISCTQCYETVCVRVRVRVRIYMCACACVYQHICFCVCVHTHTTHLLMHELATDVV